ncbi:uncharacterized protein LOC107610451 [Arachis ipaensis]|uniref:uncharacterized protein LOC107610451 n=1 Tax=Arachis ipaensis TaxID=130454 RepID=UPI0007AF6FF5|nr:uncharacterized protein LOC107610451 [Arachis ipaensis]XP_025669819.1 uncharacterized protein LOC112769525 [Arachis hypogaea]
MVKKSSEKWRMCAYFTDLNKDHPKDSYPLPNIDRLVDNTSGYQVLSFMDAYSGYNQILMHPDDEDKTAFVTDEEREISRIYAHKQRHRSQSQQMPSHNEHAVPEDSQGSTTSHRLLSRPIQILTSCRHQIYRFFKIMKKSDKFVWTEDCKKAFSEFKYILASSPILKKPEQGKPLFISLSISANTITSVLVTEAGNEQHPVYFVSKVLQNAEKRYPMIEKLAFDLVIIAQRLRHYFQTHPIIVRTGHPLRPSRSIELSEFDISYQTQGSPKAQALADFISEFTIKEETIKTWELYVDRASNENGCGAGILLKDDTGVQAEQSIKFLFKTTNNQAEYEALLAGLRLAKEVEISSLKVHCDSLLVVQQEKDWRRPFIPYIKSGETLEGESPRIFRYKANHYTLLGEDLYRQGVSRPLLKCVGQAEAEAAMEEVHNGICTAHPQPGQATTYLRCKLAISQMGDGHTRTVPNFNRFGLPREIVSDNDRQFTDKKIASYLTDLHIKHRFSSVEHPQTNGLTEAANKVILQALKKKLTNAKGHWAELIPEVLWSYNTTPQTTTNERPFRLVYGADCMIPIKISQGSTRTEYFDEQDNSEARAAKLDLINEDRSLTELRQKAMQATMQKQYNKKMRPRTLKEGDFVLRQMEEV